MAGRRSSVVFLLNIIFFATNSIKTRFFHLSNEESDKEKDRQAEKWKKSKLGQKMCYRKRHSQHYSQRKAIHFWQNKHISMTLCLWNKGTEKREWKNTEIAQPLPLMNATTSNESEMQMHICWTLRFLPRLVSDTCRFAMLFLWEFSQCFFYAFVRLITIFVLQMNHFCHLNVCVNEARTSDRRCHRCFLIRLKDKRFRWATLVLS